MSYKITWNNNDVMVVFSGHTSAMEIIKSNDEIIGNARFSSMNYHIVDLRSVIGITEIPNQVKILATLNKSSSIWNGHVKVAIIVTDAYIKQLCEQYVEQMKQSTWEVRIFETIDDAQFWCSKNFRN